jgi:lipopolysaccharide transport system permease protein
MAVPLPQEKPAATRVTRIAPQAGWLDVDFAEIWAHRELLYFFVWRDIKVRYKQTVIGAGWAILQPLMTMLVFTLFFGRLAKIPSNGIPYPVFFYSALLPWMYFATALAGATGTMLDNQRMITKVYFPRVILPVSAVLSGLVDFAIGFVLLLGLMVWYGVAPGPALLWLPLLMLLSVFTALGAGLWLAAWNTVYRDVRYVIPFLIQLWMFASPVAYPSTLVPENWRWLYGLNPMAGVIEGFRWALTGQGTAPGALILLSAAAVLALLGSGLMYFQRMEGTMADVV